MMRGVLVGACAAEQLCIARRDLAGPGAVVPGLGRFQFVRNALAFGQLIELCIDQDRVVKENVPTTARWLDEADPLFGDDSGNRAN
jgi:hypothetical protein